MSDSRPASRLGDEVHDAELPDMARLSVQEQRANLDRLRPTTRRMEIEDPVQMRRLAISRDIRHQRDEREALIQLVRKHATDKGKTEEEIKAITDNYSRMDLFREGNDKLKELRNRLVLENWEKDKKDREEREAEKKERKRKEAEFRVAAHEAAEVVRLKGEVRRTLQNAHDVVYTRCTPPYLGSAGEVMATYKRFNEDPLAIDKLDKRELEVTLSRLHAAHLVFGARPTVEGRAKALEKLKKKEAAARAKLLDPRRSNKECTVMSLSKDGSHHPNLTTRQEARYRMSEEGLRARWSVG